MGGFDNSGSLFAAVYEFKYIMCGTDASYTYQLDYSILSFKKFKLHHIIMLFPEHSPVAVLILPLQTL